MKKVIQSKKGTKKPEVQDEEPLPLSLQERLILEKKSWQRGMPRLVAQEAVKLWYTIPVTFLGMAEPLARKLGLHDPDVLWLLQFQTQKALAEGIQVHEPYVSTWLSDAAKNGHFDEVKTFFRKLTKNVIGALYHKALQEGDAPRVKFYMQCIEDWQEKFGTDVSMSYSISPEEKAEMDRLLKQNTKP